MKLLQLKTSSGTPKIKVMALQEAGLVPDGTTGPGPGPVDSFVVYAVGTGTPYTVGEYLWSAGGDRAPFYYIYYLSITGVGHLNVVLVTRTQVPHASFRVIPPSPLANGVVLTANRPMLGVQMDATTFFWTGHARPESKGIPANGNDADNMIAAINASGVSAHWVFAGDLNRSPAKLVVPAGATTLSSKNATHESGSILDYVVTNDAPANLAKYNVVVENSFGSDHWPISAGVGMAAS